MMGRELITPAHLKGLSRVGTLRHLTLSWLCVQGFEARENVGFIEHDLAWKSSFSTSPVTSLSFPNVTVQFDYLLDGNMALEKAG
jgi:hypothetical protein